MFTRIRQGREREIVRLTRGRRVGLGEKGWSHGAGVA